MLITQVRYGALLLLIALSPFARAATLKPETEAAWDGYLEQATTAMHARLQPGAKFLWLEEEPDRMEFVRTKGPLIDPIGKHIPLKVPHGLIHDWLGADFVPNARIEDILCVIRDYDSYKRIYRPGVIDSLSHGREGEKDLFFMRLANHSVVSKTALNTECEAHYIRVDAHRWYAYSNTISINELAHFGTPEQVTLPEDTGTGLIWRLSSITRLEQRDGGVYVELEALALSRDIPIAFRAFVTPIVRRVSRESLATSLHQTKLAIDDQLPHNGKVNACAITQVGEHPGFRRGLSMTSTETSNPARQPTEYYPWWLDNPADDVTGEGAAIEGTLHGAEEVRKLVLDAWALYRQHEFQFTGNYGDQGFIEEYTCLIHGAPNSAVVRVTRNTAGKAKHIVVNHRPRSSVLLFASVMGEKYAGTPLAKYFTTSECSKVVSASSGRPEPLRLDGELPCTLRE